jgi:hypothetical protein
MSKTQITAQPGIRRPAQILQAAFAEGRLDDRLDELLAKLQAG